MTNLPQQPNPERKEPSKEEVDAYLVHSTDLLIHSGVGAFLRANNESTHKFVDSRSETGRTDDKYLEAENHLYYSELPLAVVKSEYVTGGDDSSISTALSLVRVKPNGEYDWHQMVDVLEDYTDDEGSTHENLAAELGVENAVQLEEAVISLSAKQEELGWSPKRSEPSN